MSKRLPGIISRLTLLRLTTTPRAPMLIAQTRNMATEQPPAAKRRRVAAAEPATNIGSPRSLHHPISPPPPSASSRRQARDGDDAAPAAEFPGALQQEQKLIPSPFRLTKIRDLGPEDNVDAVSLADLLGDPLIAECWEFNYLHDVDFLMSHFDEDTRDLVRLHIVHGFWKKEDPNKFYLEQQAAQYNNIELHSAFTEMFGTHHTKMMILFRHDDTAQVIIHTANMIAKDWTNLTNAVWQSPLLPLLSDDDNPPDDAAINKDGTKSKQVSTTMEIGSGERFKHDLLHYLRAYNYKRPVCPTLVRELSRYDFSAVRGALIASVPGKHKMEAQAPALVSLGTTTVAPTQWGWAAVRKTIKSVPISPQEGKEEEGQEKAEAEEKKAEIVVQVSSIATLGPSETWLKRTLLDSFVAPTQTSSSSSSLSSPSKPTFRLVFPSPDEIRRSLDGYSSGGSIHMKIQSSQQAKQLQYMRHSLCHWANDSEMGTVLPGKHLEAGRQRAAPHIKTYIRYRHRIDQATPTIDWALLTSANLSKQAWGETANAAGEIRIASWEIGVMVWPELLSGDPGAQMVGTFKTDLPLAEQDGSGAEDKSKSTLVGLRIPYSLPLRRYGPTELPWVATANYPEPDWKGMAWVD